ncbi:MAG TPA: urease accessory UreF family protein [Gemmatimonadales bacterium]
MTGDLLPFLGSLQLSDSAFPSGLYTLSHGLEAYAQAGQLSSGRDLEALITDLLRHGVGPADGVALANAHRGALEDDPELVATADLRLVATKLAREARAASVRTGKQLLDLASSLFDHPVLAHHAERVRRGELPGSHAVALGLVTAALGVTREHAMAGELYAFCVGCTGAAIRLSLIDHREAQRLLHALKPVIGEVVLQNVHRKVGDIASSVPLVDVMAMRHEHADGRLFTS